MPETTRRPARKRRPGLTKDQFLEAMFEFKGDAAHFLIGYVSNSIPAHVRYEAIEAAKQQGWLTDGEG